MKDFRNSPKLLSLKLMDLTSFFLVNCKEHKTKQNQKTKKWSSENGFIYAPRAEMKL